MTVGVASQHTCTSNGNRVSTDAAYLNVPSTNDTSSSAGIPLTLEQKVTAKNPAITGNSFLFGMSVPSNSSATTYYNIPKLTPRNSRSGSQSAGGSYASHSLPLNVSGNPLVPRRRKTSPVYRNCSAIKSSSKDCAPHSYNVSTLPSATTHVNHFPARSQKIARSKSLNNIRSSSPFRKEKPPVHSNNINNNNSENLRRRYSVGDIVHKLQAFVSSGLPLRRRLARSMSRFSMTHSADPAASVSKVSPEQSPVEDGFVAPPSLKQRSTSEILHKSSQPDDVIPTQKCPSPEKDVPPVPPPRLVVRPKPAAKMKVS